MAWGSRQIVWGGEGYGLRGRSMFHRAPRCLRGGGGYTNILLVVLPHAIVIDPSLATRPNHADGATYTPDFHRPRVTLHKDDDTRLLVTNQPHFTTANNPSAAGPLVHPGYRRNVAHSAGMTALQVPRATSTSPTVYYYSTHKTPPRHTRATQGGTRVLRTGGTTYSRTLLSEHDLKK